MGEPRDPRMDPKEGDLLYRGDQEVEIHLVKDDKVYFGARGRIGGGQMSLEEFRESAKTANRYEASA